MLPEHVNIILLSATVPNTKEFADWVGYVSPVVMAGAGRYIDVLMSQADKAETNICYFNAQKTRSARALPLPSWG